MRLLYINDELATGDGSNSHAVGMLLAFKEVLGDENVESYPDPENGSEKAVNYGVNKLKAKLKGILAVIRYFRKKYTSIRRSKEIISRLNNKRYIPTHIIARSTDFDVTSIYVARWFKAKLVYEINTPMFYERGVIKKEPMICALEKWEKRIIEASDYVYVVSNICRDMLCEHYGSNKDKFIVIPNGYMAELYTDPETERKQIRNEIRQIEGVEDKFVVAFLGSLKVWHGIKTFCETAELMQQDKDVIFLVLGDGEMHDMIADYTKNHSNMIFKGKVSLKTMKRYLYASDLGIMPYAMQDNFYYSPLKMYDMIGSGLPFIGTSVGQIEEYCKENAMENALLEIITASEIKKKISAVKSGKIKIEQFNQKCDTWLKRSQMILQYIGGEMK